MKEMWEERYSSEDFAYGEAPNAFFKEVMDSYDLEGKILMPAEGEGRNAVYAAKMGLDVTAFDISLAGKQKAVELAEKEKVNIRYEVGDFLEMKSIHQQYDVVGLIYAHFPPPLLSVYHAKIAELVKPNGWIILEGFSKNHLKFREANPKVGGPNKLEMLFSKESVQQDFPGFKVHLLEEVEVELKEGKFHNGLGSVIRFIGQKNR